MVIMRTIFHTISIAITMCRARPLENSSKNVWKKDQPVMDRLVNGVSYYRCTKIIHTHAYPHMASTSVTVRAKSLHEPFLGIGWAKKHDHKMESFRMGRFRLGYISVQPWRMCVSNVRTTHGSLYAVNNGFEEHVARLVAIFLSRSSPKPVLPTYPKIRGI